MPNLTIKVGGRDFEVACQEGEEQFLQSAAKKLGAEAEVLVNQIGRMPESRMLLMAGLMLADRTEGVEDELAKTLDEVKALRAEVDALKSEKSDVDLKSLATLADRAEALADQLEASAT
jgi:cell division protein ZapA